MRRGAGCAGGGEDGGGGEERAAAARRARWRVLRRGERRGGDGTRVAAGPMAPTEGWLGPVTLRETARVACGRGWRRAE